MNKKTSITIVVILIGVISLVWWSNSTKSTELSANDSTKSHPARTGGALIAKEVFYDFGTISMKNGNVSKVFRVANSTSGDITFPSLTTSCMCTSAYFVESDGNKSGPFGMPGMGFVPKLNKTIKAGQTADIEVVYDPNAHGPAGVGMIDRFAYLEDTNGNKLQFEIKAVVTP
jgi:Protein of unknown function (DUF1573)